MSRLGERYVQHVERNPRPPFPVFGCMFGALALIVGYGWVASTPRGVCAALGATLPSCGDLAMVHSGAAVAGLVLAALAALCFARHW